MTVDADHGPDGHAVPNRQGTGRTEISHPVLVVAAVDLAVLLVMASITALNVAFTDIGRDFGADQSEIQWIVDAYALLLAALLLPAGALGDRFGRQRALVAGLAVLFASLAWSALASSTLELVVSRGLGGVGAAFVLPATLSTITSAFGEERRGQLVGLWTASAALGGIIGMLISGVMVEMFWWGSIFVFLAGATFVVGVVAVTVVPDTRDPEHSHLDGPGSLASVVAVGGLVFAIIEGPTRGWTSTQTMGGLLIGVAGLAVFVVWELRTRRPLLDVRLFAREPELATGSASLFLQFFAGYGCFFLSMQFLAYVWDYGPALSALALVPLGAGLIPVSAVANRLAARWGRAPVAATGLTLLAVAYLALAALEQSSEYWHFGVAYVMLGVGLGLATPPATEAIIEALPLAKQGVASALNDVARELGAAMGIAVLGSAFNSAYRARVGDLAERVPDAVLDVARDSPAAGLEAAARLGPAGVDTSRVVLDAFVHGWRAGMLVALATMVLGVGFVVARAIRREPSEGA